MRVWLYVVERLLSSEEVGVMGSCLPCPARTLLPLGLPAWPRLENREPRFSDPPLVAPGWAVIGRDQIQLLDIWKAGAGWRPPLCWFAVKHSCGRVWPSVAALTEGPAAASRLSGAGARDILFGVGGVYLAGQGGFAADG